jgi:hypothetical protein
MSELSVADKGWHVMRQLQVLADYERLPWYLPDIKAMSQYNVQPDGNPGYLDDPEVVAFVDELLSRDVLAKASMQWWEEKDCLRFKVARRLFYLDNWETEGSLVRNVALNMALKGKIAEVQTYLMGAADATSKRCFIDIRSSIRLLVES